MASFAQAPKRSADRAAEGRRRAGRAVDRRPAPRREGRRVGRRRGDRAGRRGRRPHRLGADHAAAAPGASTRSAHPGDRAPAASSTAAASSPRSAYGAAGVAMGTRFLLTPRHGRARGGEGATTSARRVTDTVVTTQIDGVPHRVLAPSSSTSSSPAAARCAALPRALRQRVAVPQALGHLARRRWRRRAWRCASAGPHLDADADGGQRADAHQGRAGRRQGRRRACCRAGRSSA